MTLWRRRIALAAGLCALPPLPPGGLSAQEPDGPRTTLGGYGEVHYTNRSGPGTPRSPSHLWSV